MLHLRNLQKMLQLTGLGEQVGSGFFKIYKKIGMTIIGKILN
ncbi:hypothetical protein PRO82_000514 [Candidatus Protochlamydia amoebophila]|nr:hypothetical protein [Candidatus Protochlamydia amoebophila]